jgi:hypothetical protein
VCRHKAAGSDDFVSCCSNSSGNELRRLPAGQASPHATLELRPNTAVVIHNARVNISEARRLKRLAACSVSSNT